MDEPAVHDFDVIIIGGGLTGLRAALQVYRSGYSCALLSKVHPLRSHSVSAQGGMNAALGNVPGSGGTIDSWERHAYDTVKGSDYLADQDAVVRMCKEAPATVIELEHMGTVWSRLENGKIAQRPFGGAGFPRTCYAADRTGHNILHTLYEQVTDTKIPQYEEFFVTSLVTDAGRCTGCTALEIMTGKIHGFSAKAILMATGGFGRIFSRSTNAIINTGDGPALAIRAGADLKDMEFVQFHPTSLRGTSILISEAARGEGGILINKNGERFMTRYAPRSLDLAPRDVVARAIEQEIAAGRSFDGGYVHLDLRHLGEKLIRERLPGIRLIAMDFPAWTPLPNRSRCSRPSIIPWEGSAWELKGGLLSPASTRPANAGPSVSTGQTGSGGTRSLKRWYSVVSLQMPSSGISSRCPRRLQGPSCQPCGTLKGRSPAFSNGTEVNPSSPSSTP